MSYWPGKVALVTGGSSGLGRAIAAALATRGANVVIAARGSEKLAATADELGRHGSQVVPITADITRQEDVDNLVRTTLERFGKLDMLVNNAGRSARGEVLATTAEEFAALMELNLIGLVRCTRAAADLLIRSQGHLVNIGSLAGKSAARYLGAYPATKFAVTGYNQQLRLELGPRGVHVLLVSSGPIARAEPRPAESQLERERLAALPASARQPGGGVRVKLLRPELVAERILRACERRQAELVLPAKARLLFALAALSPRLGDWLVRKMT